MADTKADQIIDNLVTTLQGLTVANGYSQDVGVVSLKYRGLNKVSATQHPAIFILNMGEDLAPQTNEEYESIFHIYLACTYKPSAVDIDYITEYNRWVGDIKKILLQDIRRGHSDFVETTLLKRVTPISDWKNTPVEFVIEIDAVFYFDKDSP